MTQNSNAGHIIEAVERLVHLEIVPETPLDVIALSSGKVLHDLRTILDKRLPAPRRKVGTSTHTTLDSLIAHAIRHRIGSSVLFADDSPTAPALLAVYDYHEGADASPHFGEHRARYAFPIAEEWAAWMAAAGEKWLSQRDFAELLEARIVEVLEPSKLGLMTRELADKLGLQLANQAALLSAAKGLSVRVNLNITNAVTTSSGETELVFEQKHEAKNGGPLTVPNAFAIGIPVFRGGTPYALLARLRYRVTDAGAVVWGVRFHRPEVCFREAFTEAGTKAQRETDLPMFYGAPEKG